MNYSNIPVDVLRRFADQCRERDDSVKSQVDDCQAIDMFFQRHRDLQEQSKKRKRDADQDGGDDGRSAKRKSTILKKKKKKKTKLNKSSVKGRNGVIVRPRPLSGYFLFCADQREAVKEVRPDITFAEMSQELSRRWHAADQSVRDGFEAQSRDQRPPPPTAEELQLRKRAASSFMIFSNEHRMAVKTAHPEWSFGQIAIEIGRMWGELSDEEKQPYTDAHRKQHDALSALRADATPQRPAVPAKPLSSFFMYSKDQRPLLRAQFPDLPQGQIAKKLGEQWNTLSESEKTVYVNKALVQHHHGDLTLPTSAERATFPHLSDEQWQARFMAHIHEILTKKEQLTEWSEKRLRKVLVSIYGEDKVQEFKPFLKDIIKSRVQALLVEQ